MSEIVLQADAGAGGIAPLYVDKQGERLVEYGHIYKVEVFTGDDDYQETDCIVATHGANDQLHLARRLEPKIIHSDLRLRGEPGVRVFINSEEGPSVYVRIGHHKGQIFLTCHTVNENLG